MMRAFVVSTGEMLCPAPIRLEGVSGVGWELAAPGSPAYEQWRRASLPAGPHEEGIAARLRASLHNSQR